MHTHLKFQPATPFFQHDGKDLPDARMLRGHLVIHANAGRPNAQQAGDLI